MSHLFSPTDLVVPFEHLRMSDVEAVGGKNASLGEMISQLPSGVKVPTGKAVIVALAAGNRDPRRWGDDANEFRLKRPGIREHIAFGRGVHTCAGAPLARAEVATILNRFFDHTRDIAISEAMHGKRGARRYQFEPSFIIRGLENLHLELTPA